jgi:hypothetical protein
MWYNKHNGKLWHHQNFWWVINTEVHLPGCWGDWIYNRSTCALSDVIVLCVYCAVLGIGGLDGALIWVLFVLNCKWWCSMGYCDISDHCLFCCTIWPFSSLSFILHASSHFCTATVEAIEAEKGTIRVLALGRDLWCVGGHQRMSYGCVLLS